MSNLPINHNKQRLSSTTSKSQPTPSKKGKFPNFSKIKQLFSKKTPTQPEEIPLEEFSLKKRASKRISQQQPSEGEQFANSLLQELYSTQSPPSSNPLLHLNLTTISELNCHTQENTLPLIGVLLIDTHELLSKANTENSKILTRKKKALLRQAPWRHPE